MSFPMHGIALVVYIIFSTYAQGTTSPSPTIKNDGSLRGADRYCENAHFEGDLLPGFDVVYPVMTRRDKLRPISTFSQASKTHRRHIVIRFTYKGHRHRLKLEHNGKLKLRKNANSGKDYEQVNDCCYQGYCTKKDHTSKENFVSLSTCDGLRGVIEIDGISHAIYPQDSNQRDMICRPHLVYKMSPTKDRSCGNQSGQWVPFEKLDKAAFVDQTQQLSSVRHRVKRNTEPKHLELALVMDKSLFAMFGNSEDRATEFILQVTNIVDMYYQSLNTRVGLVYSDFWTDDKISISTSPRETLQSFLTYADTKLNEVTYDLVHLLSGHSFAGNSSGLAIPDSICTGRGVAVISSQSNDNSRQLASVISHMIGHAIGLLHDTDDCKCEDKISGCIMNPNIGLRSPTQFSSCSRSRLELLAQVGLGSCLVDESTANPYPQFCGNGFVERGEQCDCGPAANCEKVDPCCDPSTCLLKFWAKCRAGPCCHNCLPKSSTDVCRPAQGECDAAEYCNGDDGECSANALIADGQPCTKGYCYQGQCPSHDAQCKQLWSSSSNSAPDKCYTSNNALGIIDLGHCGLDGQGKPVKCADRDAFCGLLQCEGGASYPIPTELNYKETSSGTNGDEKLNCKIVTAKPHGDLTNVGLVADGTKCSDNKICRNHRCVSSAAIGSADCSKGVNNQTCSGNGRCTSIKTCSCSVGYRGTLCDEMIPTSSSIDSGGSESAPPGGTSSGLETKWLVVIICSVAAAVALSIFLACVLCRRQIVSPSRKKANTRRQSHLNESLTLDKDRTIRFGQTPSYRNEKDGKRKRRRKRRQSSSSGEDETDSDDRKSVGVRVDIAIPEELSRQPERGILKKVTSSAFEGIEEDCCNSQCSCTDSGSCSCSDHEGPHTPTNAVASPSHDTEQEIPPPLEFDTNAYVKRFETHAQVEITPNSEISPTDSEDMKYCATEADQFYKNFSPPYDKYAVYAAHMPHPAGGDYAAHLQPPAGGDSATDSAIDMPGDGSVSTINDIPPHHSTAIGSSYYKHTPTIADYSDMQLSECSPNDMMPRPQRPPKYSKPPLFGLLDQSRNSKPLSATTVDLHPVIHEYNRSPIIKSRMERNDYVRDDAIPLQTFHSSNGSRDLPQNKFSSSSNHTSRDENSVRQEEEFITV